VLKNFLLLIVLNLIILTFVLIAAIGNGENGHDVEDEKRKRRMISKSQRNLVPRPAFNRLFKRCLSNPIPMLR
jgi:hypothetical protein